MNQSSLDQMIQGYMDGIGWNPHAHNFVDEWLSKKPAAYRHGFMNGMDDKKGKPRESADVLRRRAAMILGDNE